MLPPITFDDQGRVKIVPTGEKCAECGRPLTNVSEYRYVEGDPEGRKWCLFCGTRIAAYWHELEAV